MLSEKSRKKLLKVISMWLLALVIICESSIHSFADNSYLLRLPLESFEQLNFTYNIDYFASEKEIEEFLFAALRTKGLTIINTVKYSEQQVIAIEEHVLDRAGIYYNLIYGDDVMNGFGNSHILFAHNTRYVTEPYDKTGLDDFKKETLKVANDFYKITQDKLEILELVYDYMVENYQYAEYDRVGFSHLIMNKSGNMDDINLMTSKLLTDFGIENRLCNIVRWDYSCLSLVVTINGKEYFYSPGDELKLRKENGTAPKRAFFLVGDEDLKKNSHYKEYEELHTTSFNPETYTKEKVELGTNVYETLRHKFIFKEPKKIDISVPYNLSKENPEKGTSKWAQASVIQSIKKNIIPINIQENYQKALTRGELASVLVEIYLQVNDYYPEHVGSPIKDGGNVTEFMAYNAGYMKGVTATDFGAGYTVTREQLATIIVNALNVHHVEYSKENTLSFTDKTAISSWAQEAVSITANLGLIKGYSDGRYNPKNAVTREEAIILMGKLFDLVKSSN